ncbi:hypothetical protein MVEN_02184100 [Mycena venus]|uniref:Uncharacterized protein n=1 Tax=Mycena venus TaxID=2733690 RepID=A0A8H7CHC2_9AGAR|nr:hypothetical protein MVEN_02184100 [Mycena venus]
MLRPMCKPPPERHRTCLQQAVVEVGAAGVAVVVAELAVVGLAAVELVEARLPAVGLAKLAAVPRALRLATQTHDKDGTPIPLPLSAVAIPLQHEMREIRGKERVQDKTARAAEAKEAWVQSLLRNPDGGTNLVIVPPLKPRRRAVEDMALTLPLPEGLKRIRKPAASREMPVPVSVRPVSGAADARQKKLDTELLAKLTRDDQAMTGKKCERNNDENNNNPRKK